MIDRSHAHPVDAGGPTRDERSMRVMEYAMALVSLAVAVLLAIR